MKNTPSTVTARDHVAHAQAAAEAEAEGEGEAEAEAEAKDEAQAEAQAMINGLCSLMRARTHTHEGSRNSCRAPRHL